MARHKPKEERVEIPGMGSISKQDLATEVMIEEARHPLTLAGRLEQAKAKLEASVTIADACYWQGALDALNALSRGARMPEVIGAGVPK